MLETLRGKRVIQQATAEQQAHFEQVEVFGQKAAKKTRFDPGRGPHCVTFEHVVHRLQNRTPSSIIL